MRSGPRFICTKCNMAQAGYLATLVEGVGTVCQECLPKPVEVEKPKPKGRK